MVNDNEFDRVLELLEKSKEAQQEAQRNQVRLPVEHYVDNIYDLESVPKHTPIWNLRYLAHFSDPIYITGPTEILAIDKLRVIVTDQRLTYTPQVPESYGDSLGLILQDGDFVHYTHANDFITGHKFVLFSEEDAKQAGEFLREYWRDNPEMARRGARTNSLLNEMRSLGRFID